MGEATVKKRVVEIDLCGARGGAVNGVLRDDATAVLTGSWDHVEMGDLCLRVELPPGTVSTESVGRARREALRALVSRLSDDELEDVLVRVARANRCAGFDDAVAALRAAPYEG